MINKGSAGFSLALMLCSSLLFMTAQKAKAAGLELPARDSVPVITVIGHASTEVVPDTALISIGVMTEKPQAAAAASENARAAQTLIDTLKAQGVEAKDIRTLRVTLLPVYDEAAEPGNKKRVLRGYRARNDLVLRVSPITRVGELAGSLLDKGVNVIDGIDFDLSDRDKVLDRLRAEAAKDALAQAKTLAAALDAEPARVLVIQPQGQIGFPVPMARAQKVAFAQGDNATVLPVEPGTQTLQIEVQVTFELAPSHP